MKSREVILFLKGGILNLMIRIQIFFGIGGYGSATPLSSPPESKVIVVT
jgi:hypothetical protein